MFAFTLVELLLVLVIMLIAVGTAVPAFVQSYRGARLRTAVRHVVMAGRYTRGLAVLGQLEGAFLLDRVRSTLEVVTLASGMAEADRKAFMQRGQMGAFGLSRDTPDIPENTEESPALSESRLQRRLPEGIRIEGVVTEEGVQELDGLFWVRYYANGMCDGYEVMLADERNARARVRVDAVTGRPEAIYDF